MRLINNRYSRIAEKSETKDEIPAFESITQRLLSLPKSNQIKCPSCGNLIDFNKGVTWQGPDTFTCGGCDRHLSMHLVHRALRDLGME